MKTYWLQFGSGDPRNNSGLAPTMLIFMDQAGATYSPPSISEIGSTTGLYTFEYEPSPSLSIVFLSDGGTLLSDSDRYVTGVLDPIQQVDQNIGFTSASYGSTSADPSSVFGFAKRMIEWLEGNANFDKSTGQWNVYDRGGTLLLRQKTLTNTVTEADKS